MNVLSLFDGMSCGQIALERASIKVDKYYASEIDKWAIKVTQHNYPNTTKLGDINNWEDWETQGIDFSKIDLLMGGSPCQGFSFSGKQLAFDDPRSRLFLKYVDILNHIKKLNPNIKFLLENVKMKKQFEDIISDFLGVKPIQINSSLVSAQNRKRLYWANWENTQPRDCSIVLADILETNPDPKTYFQDRIGRSITGKTSLKKTFEALRTSNQKSRALTVVGQNISNSGATNIVEFVDRQKSFCLDANYFKGGNLKQYFEKHRRQLVFSKDGLCHVGDADIKGNDSLKRVYHTDGKSSFLLAQNNGRTPKILCGAWSGRYVVDGKRQDGKMKTAGLTTQRLEVRTDEKTNTPTTVQKDNNVIDVKNLKFRKLTPIECERLQTVPDNFSAIVSNSQRYKMLGNGWTVDVIVHILRNSGLAIAG